MGLLLRLAISAMGLWLAQALVPGIEFRSTATLLGAAILLGLVNAVIRPVVILLTLPVTVVTFGLFLLVINALMLGIVSALLSGFSLGGFGSAIAGGIVVSITSWVASWYVGPRGRLEVMTQYRLPSEPNHRY
ncbi:phage holin family protein [Myxococcota bacterium]|nr:phage holin family protein [Myxococcota bacterium]